ncbi:MAG TPA: alpha/beta hydrolase-fold protein [Mycobacteriales bacterium]|nr:alpha/beta hydrolase-fold protein [Mycobacteriales bacterium]
MPASRRALLIGAVGAGSVTAASVAAGSSSVRHDVRRLVDPVPEPKTSVPAGPTGRLVSGSFASPAMGGREIGWTVAYPPGVSTDAALAVALVLHGRSNDHATAFGSHQLQHFLAAVVRSGTPAFALASVDGADHDYWHMRANGDDPQRMIRTEFVPRLQQRGLRTARLGLSGWSMGGYGALLLAERLGSAGCAAVAADSPALWLSPGDSAPGAFDDRSDFIANDVFAGRARLGNIPVRIAIGTSDPFYVATRRFVGGLTPRPATDFSRGGHDVAFWRHAATGQLRFLGNALARA